MTAPPRDAITGIVLAGGLGRRMSEDGRGTDKGLCPFRGRPMAAHAIERLAPQVGSVAINANRHLEAWRAFGLPVFADEIEGYAGPLAGLHAAMARATTPWIATVPCDSPFLPTDLVERLARGAASAGVPIAIARAGERAQPVFMLVERALRPALEAFLASGRRRIDAWTGPLGAVEVDFADETAFRNINTADELARWEQDAPGADAHRRDPVR